MSPRRLPAGRHGRPAGPASRGAPRDRLRPTAARVRAGLYDSLGEWVVGRAVLDLFAGTGALGIEALLRGARRAVFVECDAARVRALHEQLRRQGLELRAVVRREDAVEAPYRLARAGEVFDLVLLDPPYGMGLIARSLAAIVDSEVLAPGGLVVAEGHWRDRPTVLPGQEMAREARYGETALWFIRTSDGPRS